MNPFRLPQSGGDAQSQGQYLQEQDIQANRENYFKLKIIFGEDASIEIIIPKRNTVKDLKAAIEIKAAATESLPESARDIPVDTQRLIFNGILLQDSSILESISNLADGSSILITKRPERNQAVNNEQAVGNEEEQGQLNATAHQLKHAKILQRNFKECVTSAQRNLDPSTRQRWDDASSPTPRNPTVSEFGDFAQELSETLMNWSHQLEQLGHQLREDKPLPPDRQADEYQRSRRLIQNNMDACRYVAHELTTFSRFVIPLARHPPRQLSIVTRR